MSFRTLIKLEFLGNSFLPLAARFRVGLLSLKMHIEYFCLSEGVCDNVGAISTIEVSSDKLNLNIHHYTSGQPTTSGHPSLQRDSPSNKPHKQGKSQSQIMQKKKEII